MNLANALHGSDALTALDRAHDAAWDVANSDLLSLCRNRVGMLLRHQPTLDAMTEADRAALREWPASEQLTACERAALAFTEQYVIDVASLTDEIVGDLREHLGEVGLVDFVNALLVVEQRMTLELAFEAVL